LSIQQHSLCDMLTFPKPHWQALQ